VVEYVRALYLKMSFSGQKLIRAEFADVDSAEDVNSDAPPAIM
jgi:hypothetical protein